jgi:hypothetical protein
MSFAFEPGEGLISAGSTRPRAPVKEGLAAECDDFRFCFAYLARHKTGAKAH